MRRMAFKTCGSKRLGMALMMVIVLTLSLGLRPELAHASLLTTFTVDRTNDLQDTNPGDGRCDGIPDVLLKGDQCSLRAAIMEANAQNGGDVTIVVPAGTYKLTLPGAFDDMAKTGDLDIRSAMKIHGAGVDKTVIDGGALDRVVSIFHGDVHLENLTIQHGKTPSNGVGGGLYAEYAQVTLKAVDVRNNIANNVGGGIYVTQSTLDIDDAHIADNTSPSYGGGIFTMLGVVATVSNSTISGNHAHDGGGIFTWTSTKLTVSDSTINANTASQGAGIYIYDSKSPMTTHVTASNTTFSSNIADYSGGGVAIQGGVANFNNVTVAANTAVFGSGVHVIENLPGELHIANSIVVTNVSSDPYNPSPDCKGTIVEAGYVLIGNTAGCKLTGNTTGSIKNVSPALGPLQNNGGTTFTHALLQASPALDAGNPAMPNGTNGACVATDQRLVGRPHVGTAAALSRCDMGAFEYAGPVTTSLSPSSKPAGSTDFTLTVHGTQFTAASVVRWNGQNRPTTFVNSQTLQAKISAADLATPDVASVRVLTPGKNTDSGLSNARGFTIANPVPVVASLSPASKPKGSPAFTLTITGSGFVAASKVQWKGIARPTTFVNSTTLKIQVAAADVATAGTAAVTVSSPTPGGGISNAKTFTIKP